MSSYGERLMRARKEKELSREELGKLCGITGRTIQKKEILAHASALFAGGKLSDEEQLAFIYELQTLYMKARQIIKDREDEQ